ncbi:class I SAM-dependent methyltransferase [Candidatus Poribacteria bacterium]
MLARIVKAMRSKQGRRDIRYAVSMILNPFTRKLGYTIVADHFYQPIPNDREVRVYHNRERPIDSIEWKIECQLELVSELLGRYRDEFNQKHVISSCGYSEETSALISGDAEFLYSMVRHMKPRRVIEIGGGGSTQITAAALRMNFRDLEKTEFVCIDPYPRDFLKDFSDRYGEFMRFRLLEMPVQLVDLSLFDSLGENDILFVDSSHVFKQGSDVEFEFLRIYPILTKGVIVHLHDMFFPFDYPIEWNLKRYLFWNEQYFLEAFLQFNSKFEVLASLSMVAYHDNSTFMDSIEVYDETKKPGSFWMRVAN